MRVGASVLAAALPVLIAAGLLAGELLGPGRGGAVLVVFPLLVGALAVADRGPALVLSAPWAVYGGRISYCLYLVHIPMLELYWFALQKVRGARPVHTWRPTCRAGRRGIHVRRGRGRVPAGRGAGAAPAHPAAPDQIIARPEPAPSPKDPADRVHPGAGRPDAQRMGLGGVAPYPRVRAPRCIGGSPRAAAR